MTADLLAGGDRVFVDTNVLVYIYDDADRRKQQLAARTLAEVGAERVVLSAQVLNEFVITVTRKLARPLDDARTREAVEVLGQLDVVPIDAGLVAAGVLRSQRSQLSLWDALIVESARRAGCTTLLTDDLGAGTDYGGVRVVNPFDADAQSTTMPS